MTCSTAADPPERTDGRPEAFDIVTACRKKDLPTLAVAYPKLQRYLPHRRLIIFTAKHNLKSFQNKLGSEVVILDEDQAVPNMTLNKLRFQGNLPGFPEGAGWYFQQFLKFSYPHMEPRASRYLIWDADTIPLRSFQPFGDRGTAFLTPASPECAEPPPGIAMDAHTRQLLMQATRPHLPYFENYRLLLGESPDRTQSFISQHMPIQVPCLRAMLDTIDGRHPGNDGWAWKVIRNLKGDARNLFSEYEFYAQYALRHFADQHAVRSLAWRRGGAIPRGRKLQPLLEVWAKDFDFIAMESWASPWRRIAVECYLSLPQTLRRMIRSGR